MTNPYADIPALHVAPSGKYTVEYQSEVSGIWYTTYNWSKGTSHVFDTMEDALSHKATLVMKDTRIIFHIS
jgi:hypothetical protein